MQIIREIFFIHSFIFLVLFFKEDECIFELNIYYLVIYLIKIREWHII